MLTRCIWFEISWLRLAVFSLLLALNGSCSKQPSASPADANRGGKEANPIKIGFLVKQPEEPWFQLEWKFADEAARDLGFTLLKIGATDGEKVLSAIDNLAAAGAQGFLICTPDPRLGPGIVAKAKALNLKVISVNDQFLGADGQPMIEVPYFGIHAYKIGEKVGEVLYAEMKKRGWMPAESAVCVVTFDSLGTTRERTDGAMAALVAAGFPAERIFRPPQRTTDIPGAFDATNILLTQRSEVKHWLVCGVNDNAVLGAVRALEGWGFSPESCVAVGINGTDCIVELEKERPTSFFGSMLLLARSFGYVPAEAMYRWIRDDVKPPLETRTTGMLLTRENFRQVLKEQGMRN